jgi:hypothetical protein
MKEAELLAAARDLGRRREMIRQIEEGGKLIAMVADATYFEDGYGAEYDEDRDVMFENRAFAIGIVDSICSAYRTRLAALGITFEPEEPAAPAEEEPSPTKAISDGLAGLDTVIETLAGPVAQFANQDIEASISEAAHLINQLKELRELRAFISGKSEFVLNLGAFHLKNETLNYDLTIENAEHGVAIVSGAIRHIEISLEALGVTVSK